MSSGLKEVEPLSSRVWRYRHFYLFIAPFFISFAVLGLWPLLFSLYLSFVKWNGLTPPVGVGVSNYQALLKDEQFWKAIFNTVYLFVLYVPLMLLLAFLLAVALNGPITKLRSIYRAAVFLPCVTPVVVVSIVFSIFCTYDNGLFNWMLRGVGLSAVKWQEDPFWTRVSIAILLVWRWTGYNMIFMLAGLQGISADVYEAAKIDGASRSQTLWRVTLPLMRPTFIFCTIMSLLGTVYMFEEVLLVDKNGSAQNVGVLLFNNSFSYFKFGYASAMAYVVAAVVFVMTLMVRRTQKDDQ
jgi:ABC-type sugar transport system permease subunit